MSKEKYTVYYMTQKDGSKKPIKRKIRDEVKWFRSYQLTRMKNAVSVEVCFTVNYNEIRMLQYLIEEKFCNSSLYNLPQLTEALDNAKKMVDDFTEKQFKEGKYGEWQDKLHEFEYKSKS
jgi:hypothetical protein